jgi:putative NADPH-quinone reductase
MPHIENDPTREVCPTFESQGWKYMRQIMINGHPGPQPLTAEEATQRLKDTWAQERDQRVIQWNIQLEQENAELEEQARRINEEEEARRFQQEREVEEQRREAEKRKAKLNDFDSNRAVDSWI